MLRYATTIFLSAFLLFQVQPLIAKLILPWFGGTSAVWTTCMLFFQVVLLAGYAYAHFISSRLSPRATSMVHVLLLAGSLWFLPIAPDPDAWQTAGSAQPIVQILLLLFGTIGLPYFLLSSTGPLLQESYRRETGLPPYRLYALSNIGSLLALLSYPFVFEPQLTLRNQILGWSSGYAVFALLSAVCAWNFARSPKAALAESVETKGDSTLPRPTWWRMLIWMGLAACGSMMLLATTNQLTQEVPPVPFLWIVPLALYLLTFIICFDREGWYHRAVFLPLFLVSVGLSVYAMYKSYEMPLWQQLTIYPGTMFICCMVCHGELVRLRPAAQHATLFYLLVSAGGAMGGVLVAVGAPLLLPDYWEYPIGLAVTAVLAFLAICMSASRVTIGLLLAGQAVAAILIATFLQLHDHDDDHKRIPVAATRNFYGVLHVRDLIDARNNRWRVLMNGRINHGTQFHDPVKSRQPTTYYTAHTGIGMAMNNHPRRFALDPDQQSLRVGVVGLGTGTIAANGRPGDYILFYEINPVVVEFAQKYFAYTRNSTAKIDVALGDARIRMQRQFAAGGSQNFDVMAIDAFSSDAIPVHLLTKESVELYLKHLKPDGLLCIHISNLYLDLGSVVRAIAKELDIECVFIESFDASFSENADPGGYSSTWAVLTRNQEFLEDPEVDQTVANSTENAGAGQVLWTDDYASLWRVLKKPVQWDDAESAEEAAEGTDE